MKRKLVQTRIDLLSQQDTIGSLKYLIKSNLLNILSSQFIVFVDARDKSKIDVIATMIIA
jgi:hypothetical protein